MKQTYITAIDIGTNSFHMTISKVDPSTGKFSTIDKEKEFVRLGINSRNFKHLSEESIERAIKVLKNFKNIFSNKKTIVRAVATSAIREAENANYFIQRVKKEIGIDIEVISGLEEARLIYKGVINFFPFYDKKVLVIDIGGGSTEIIIGEKKQIFYANSIKLGTIRMIEKFFTNNNFTSSKIKKCHNFIKGIIYPYLKEVKNTGFDIAVGSSGTFVTTLNISKFLFSNNDNILKKNHVKEIFKLITNAKTPNKILKIKGVPPERADLMLPGIIIIYEIFKQLNLDKIYISNFALREGLIFDTLERKYKKNYFNKLKELRKINIINLFEKFNIEKEHCMFTANLSLKIFDCLKNLHKLGDLEKEYLYYAALLHDIGLFISHNQHHIHSYYIIKNSDLLGFTENEKEIIANISRYHRKSHPKPTHINFINLQDKDKTIVLKLASILRIADGLDRMHSSILDLKKCVINKKEVKFYFTYPKKINIFMDKWGANLKKDLFEEVFQKKVSFKFSPIDKNN